MIRARTLHGRAVVDLEAAKKLGTIEDVLLDPEGSRVAGFLVAEGHSLGGGGKHWVLPAATIYAIGQDAVTVESGGSREAEGGEAQALPRLSKLIGRKMVTQGGTVLGAIEDVVLDEQSGQIGAYAFHRGHEATGGLAGLLGSHRPEQLEYVRAGGGIRVGEELVIVPDDAEVGEEPVADEPTRGTSAPARGARVNWSSGPAVAPQPAADVGRSVRV